MTVAVVFKCMDAINKYGRPKVTSRENLLGGIKTREVAIASSIVTIIKDFFSLIMGEEMT